MASVDFSTILPKIKGWSGQQYGAQGTSTWGDIATALGTDVASLGAANKGWLSGDLSPTQTVDLSWLTQNMAGRLQTPGTTGPAITQAQSDAYRANTIATQEAASAAALKAGQLTPQSGDNYGPWIKDASGNMVANPAYTGQAVSPYDPNASMVKPPLIQVPDKIPSNVLGSTSTKASVLQQAQSNQPKSTPTISSLIGQVKPGEQSANVAALQKSLMAAGYNIPALANGTAQPGFYGDQTAAALKKYQADQALIANGGKAIDTSLTGIKKSLNDTLTALNTLRDKGFTEIPDGADPIAYLNEVVMKSGSTPPKIDAATAAKVGTAEGLAQLYSTYMNYQIDRQTQLDNVMREYNGQSLALQSGKGTSGFIGAAKNALTEAVKLRAQPLLDEMKISSDTFNTAVDLAGKLEAINKPQIISNSNGIFSISPDGTIITLKDYPQSGSVSTSGAFTLGDTRYDAQGNIIATNHTANVPKTAGERELQGLASFTSKIVPGAVLATGETILNPGTMGQTAGTMNPGAWLRLIDGALQDGISRDAFLSQFGHYLDIDPKTEKPYASYKLTPVDLKALGY